MSKIALVTEKQRVGEDCIVLLLVFFGLRICSHALLLVYCDFDSMNAQEHL